MSIDLYCITNLLFFACIVQGTVKQASCQLVILIDLQASLPLGVGAFVV